jgi:hypothetical protein
VLEARTLPTAGAWRATSGLHDGAAPLRPVRVEDVDVRRGQTAAHLEGEGWLLGDDLGVVGVEGEEAVQGGRGGKGVVAVRQHQHLHVGGDVEARRDALLLHQAPCEGEGRLLVSDADFPHRVGP